MRKRPFSKKQIQTLRKVLDDHPRDLALLNTAVDSCLRSSDLLNLKVEDVKTNWGEIREKIEVRMVKTQKRVRCLFSDATQECLDRWIRVSEKDFGDYLFTPIRGGKKPIGGLAYRKIVKGWCISCGWDESYYSTHSLRRTLPSHIYNETKDLRSCQIYLGHDSPASTAVYLGVEEQDAFSLLKKHRI